MNDPKEILKWVSKLMTNPLLANIIGVFSVPITLMVTATNFAHAGKYDLLIFGGVGVLCLIYSALMALLFVKVINKEPDNIA